MGQGSQRHRGQTEKYKTKEKKDNCPRIVMKYINKIGEYIKENNQN